MTWDPNQYPNSADHRGRPDLDGDAYRPRARGIATLVLSPPFIGARLP
ncbi:MAG: hypothetical protein M3132_03565 [Actinomycetia bacterium]|nr:hypothetical protein [Actinomycetes bacterium]